MRDVHNSFLVCLRRLLETAEDSDERKKIALEMCSAEGVEFRDDAERPTLLDASEEGRKSSHIHLLLAAGAKINAAVGSRGMTPLLAAAENGHSATESPFRSSTVKVLLSSGADVSAKTTDGMTAAMLAANGEHTATVQELLSFKADLNVTYMPEEDVISTFKNPGLLRVMAGASAIMFAYTTLQPNLGTLEP
jgi:hypothetical protein